MSDDEMVRPVRTFLEGADLKTPESGAYLVSRSRAAELIGNGLVEIVEPDTPTEAPPESAAEPEAAKTSGRRPRAS